MGSDAQSMWTHGSWCTRRVSSQHGVTRKQKNNCVQALCPCTRRDAATEMHCQHTKIKCIYIMLNWLLRISFLQWGFNSVVECLICIQDVGGSIPPTSTSLFWRTSGTVPRACVLDTSGASSSMRRAVTSPSYFTDNHSNSVPHAVYRYLTTWKGIAHRRRVRPLRCNDLPQSGVHSVPESGQRCIRMRTCMPLMVTSSWSMRH
jgi:hypothetical protein